MGKNVNSIYRLNKKIKLKDDELPFTNTSVKIKNPVVDSSILQNSLSILQKTYYNVAFPPNKSPLSKLK